PVSGEELRHSSPLGGEWRSSSPETGRPAATPLRRGVLRFYCLLLLRCFIRLATARAAQNIFQRVIGFVARVFVDVGVSRGPGVFARPRPVPRIGILDGEAIQ